MNYDNKTVQERIEQIVQFEKDGEIMTFFPALTENQIVPFEKQNSITIPESYKEWLHFCNGGYLFNKGAQLYGIDNHPQPPVGDDFSSGMVPTEYLILGSFNSMHICYDKTHKKFFFYEYEEPVQYFDSFAGVLAYIIDICTS